MKQPTNEVLLEKLEHIHEKIDGVNDRLDKLNGQVAKNTEHRAKQSVTNKILGAIGISLIGIVTKLLFF